MSTLKVSKIQHINSSGNGFVFDEKGTVGIGTSVMDANVVRATSSAVGEYVGDGSLVCSNNLSRAGGYYIATDINALNAGPVQLNTVMTLKGTWVIV